VTARFRELYGAGPLHLAAALACFAVVAYALSTELGLTGRPERVLLWFGGAIAAHDFVLFPIYALLGVIATGVLVPASRRTRLGIAALNHLRLPALLSGLLLLVWFPLIAGPAGRTFMRATGLTKDVYLDRWLLLTAALFGMSGIVFALRVPGLRRAR
jgi:hypothetical protein